MCPRGGSLLKRGNAVSALSSVRRCFSGGVRGSYSHPYKSMSQTHLSKTLYAQPYTLKRTLKQDLLPLSCTFPVPHRPSCHHMHQRRSVQRDAELLGLIISLQHPNGMGVFASYLDYVRLVRVAYRLCTTLAASWWNIGLVNTLLFMF